MPIEGPFRLSKDPLRLSGGHLMPIECPFRPSKGSQTDTGPLKTTQGPLRPTDGPLRPTEGPLKTVRGPLYFRPAEPGQNNRGPSHAKGPSEPIGDPPDPQRTLSGRQRVAFCRLSLSTLLSGVRWPVEIRENQAGIGPFQDDRGLPCRLTEVLS